MTEFVVHKCFLKGALDPSEEPDRTGAETGSGSPSAPRRDLQPVKTNVCDNVTLVLYARRCTHT